VRVLQVTHTFLPKIGGAEILLDRLCRRLVDGGLDTTVLTEEKRSRPAPPGALPYALRTWRRSKVREAVRGRIRGEIDGIVDAIRAANADQGYDLIHAHYGYPAGVAAIEAGRELGLPVAITSQGGDFFESSSHSRASPAIWERVTDAYRRADAVVSISPYTRDQFLSIDVAADRIVDIPNAVDPKELEDPGEPEDASLSSLRGAPFVLAIGRLTANKGFDLLIQAWALAGLGASGLRLVFAGEGRDRDLLRRLVERHALQDGVAFIGSRTGRDKAWLFHHSLFVAMPSREEGMPLVGIESMLVGKPLLASDITALAYIVDSPHRGMTFPSGDVEALARTLVALLDRDLAVMGREASAFGQDFTIDRCAERHRSLYERLASTHANPATAR